MSEYINNQTKRKETLKRLIRQLHQGKSVEDVKDEFDALLRDIGATEVAEIELALIAEGLPEMEVKLHLDTGALTVQQVNHLLINLPVDITYVDADDTVRFFSQTKERIFPRSPAIIGRKVQKCHPPASVHRVQRILDDFRAGHRDVAEFWIQMQGRFIHIRYYAVRDEQGAYQGTIEVSQDVTHIRALEGERRLLDDGQ